jgi:hypothetical protein
MSVPSRIRYATTATTWRSSIPIGFPASAAICASIAFACARAFSSASATSWSL